MENTQTFFYSAVKMFCPGKQKCKCFVQERGNANFLNLNAQPKLMSAKVYRNTRPPFLITHSKQADSLLHVGCGRVEERAVTSRHRLTIMKGGRVPVEPLRSSVLAFHSMFLGSCINLFSLSQNLCSRIHGQNNFTVLLKKKLVYITLARSLKKKNWI